MPPEMAGRRMGGAKSLKGPAGTWIKEIKLDIDN